MPRAFDPNKFNREMRAAQRKAEAAYKREVQKANREIKREVDRVNAGNKREVDRVNRENQRRVDAHNRKVDAQNKKATQDHNRRVAARNREADAHNKKVLDGLNRQLRAAGGAGPRYTESEQALADRVVQALPPRDEREIDIFLSYARIDGAEVSGELRDRMDDLGVTVWFDELDVKPGHSQSLQMDRGLQRARAGIVVLTPAYIAGRFWTERELGALLGKETLIPVLHQVTFNDVKEYSGILPDLAGFETARDPIDVIAEKIAAAVLD